jgi:peptidoglycan/xylan/chitin deacetylase (PgdA/CDA1 family)
MFRPLVLCYHAISSSWADQLAVDPRALERQLRTLSRSGYVPVDGVTVLGNRPRTLHVTFDDAYHSVADALPLLERFRIRASVFVCTGFAADGRPLLIPELRGRVGSDPAPLATMDWATLEHLAERGIEIGSHTVSHPHLPALGEPELDAELRDSRAEIEDRLGQPCRLLAYPFGDHDERVRRAAARAGYEAAFALRARAWERHALPRVDVYRHDGRLRFTLKVSAARRPAIALLDALRRLTCR